MRGQDPFDVVLRSASLATIRTVRRRRLQLLRDSTPLPLARKALPLDFSEPKPFEASLSRNIAAALGETAWATVRPSGIDPVHHTDLASGLRYSWTQFFQHRNGRLLAIGGPIVLYY